MEYQPMPTVEEIIARGKFAIVEALEGRMITTPDGIKTIVADGKYRVAAAMGHIVLCLKDEEFLAQLLRTSLIPVYYRQPENEDEREALDWMLAYHPNTRTNQLKYAYWRYMQDQREYAQKLAGG